MCVCEGVCVTECICEPVCDAGPAEVDTLPCTRQGPGLAAWGCTCGRECELTWSPVPGPLGACRLQGSL